MFLICRAGWDENPNRLFIVFSPGASCFAQRGIWACRSMPAHESRAFFKTWLSSFTLHASCGLTAFQSSSKLLLHVHSEPSSPSSRAQRVGSGVAEYPATQVSGPLTQQVSGLFVCVMNFL
jgi:hypothetical protein